VKSINDEFNKQKKEYDAIVEKVKVLEEALNKAQEQVEIQNASLLEQVSEDSPADNVVENDLEQNNGPLPSFSSMCDLAGYNLRFFSCYMIENVQHSYF
jgi:chromosome segregation ATPase